MRKVIFSTFVFLLFCVLMLTFFIGCGKGTNVNKYKIKMNDENWLYEKLPSSAIVGDRVSVKIKFATDLGYIFMVNGERIKQDDNVESRDYWQFSFTMPNEDVVIDFKTYDGFLPTPEYGTLIETYLIQNPDSEYVRVREYYGEYDSGAIVAMIDAEEYTSNEWSEEVAGRNFVYGDGNRLKVLYEGKFYTLPQAYEKEYLTKENVSEIFSKYSANHLVAYGDSITQDILKLWQTFEYDGVEYDLSEIYSGVNGVSKWGEIGKYVIAEGHVNPYNSIYAVINTKTKELEHYFAGSVPTYYDGVDSIVYAFWNSIRRYDGTILVDLKYDEGEYISKLTYIDNGQLIEAKISNDDTIIIDISGNILEMVDNNVLNAETSPSMSNSTFDFDGYEEMLKAFCEDSQTVNGWSIQDFKNILDEQYTQFVDKVSSEKFFPQPLFENKPIIYRNEEGFSNITFFVRELYGLPWIWYFPNVSTGENYYIAITYLPEEIIEDRNNITSSEVIKELSPNSANINNLGDHHKSITEMQITLSGREVTALVFEYKNDTRSNIHFVYDDLLVLVRCDTEVWSEQWFSNLSFDTIKK